jgi:hypothetical protein
MQIVAGKLKRKRRKIVIYYYKQKIKPDRPFILHQSAVHAFRLESVRNLACVTCILPRFNRNTQPRRELLLWR